MKCVNKDCDNEQDVDDLTLCWACYEEHYRYGPGYWPCLTEVLKELSE